MGQKNRGYIIILRKMLKSEMEILFEHTKQLRSVEARIDAAVDMQVLDVASDGRSSGVLEQPAMISADIQKEKYIVEKTKLKKLEAMNREERERQNSIRKELDCRYEEKKDKEERLLDARGIGLE